MALFLKTYFFSNQLLMCLADNYCYLINAIDPPGGREYRKKFVSPKNCEYRVWYAVVTSTAGLQN